MVEFCMESCYFRYKNQYYIQTYGTAMGSPLSNILAEMVLETIIDKALRELSFRIPIFRKYVDDLFLAIPKNESDRILQEFNKHEDRLQFTIEKEQNQTLPFLDMLVTRDENQNLATEWYAKPIASGRMLNYHSFHEMKHKINVAYNFVHRVVTLSKSGKQDHGTVIHHYLEKNNYPKTLINRIIQQHSSQQRHRSINALEIMQTPNNIIEPPTEPPPTKPPPTEPPPAGSPPTGSPPIQHQSGSIHPTLTTLSNDTAASAQHSNIPVTLDPPVERDPNSKTASDNQPPTEAPIQGHHPNAANNDPEAPRPQAHPDANDRTAAADTKHRSLLYIPGLTEQIRKIAHEHIPNVRISSRQHDTVGKLHSSVKDPIDKKNKHNIIYKITCNECEKCYIGMTQNKLATRLSSHRSLVNKLDSLTQSCTDTTIQMNELRQKTALMEHCVDTGHRFDMDNTDIIDNTTHPHILSFLEMCHIQNTPHTVNKRTDVAGLNTAYASILYTISTHMKNTNVRNIDNDVDTQR